MPALGQEAGGGRVFPAQLREIGTDGQARLRGAPQIRRRILNPNDHGMGGQARHRLRRHIDDRPTGDVVDDDRHANLGQRHVMAI